MWNIFVNNLSPVLPLLRYQFLNRKDPSILQSRAANLYFFTGLSAGGFALELSMQSQSVVPSIANFMYWCAFTAGMSGFAKEKKTHLEQHPPRPLSLPPPCSVQEEYSAPDSPVIRIVYEQTGA
ncbi:hypothetical protein LSG31_22365 [Fodinisporobacter ferrooxydans]|uniref:Uncharacterized protein n=1 Tax=Fodinisporobacter ferrooxydans TaxID=2901836 RepID=A0ABY4CJ65_9BACL|nr:hypothetical protein LSG31_22365 [Alicyclobacillaceae bacterium MYW30-H2]